MRVLFIGGTGNISIACTRLAVQRGIELFLFNRGQTSQPLPQGVKFIPGDIRDGRDAAQAVNGLNFDAVVDWIAYEAEHVETDIELFRGKTGQYIFISSASAYQKPPAHYRVTETVPLQNPFWQYAREKIACEDRLFREHRDSGFPVTVVRPSLTYGDTWIPCAVGGHEYTIADRMRKGKKVIVHGDGQSLWTMTHNTDFATGLVGLLGNSQAIGESYHITSDEVLTWDRIYQAIGRACGVEPDLIHIPSEFINLFDPRTGAGLLGDKAYSLVFDNSKIKRAVPEFQASVPFEEGIRRSIGWFDAEQSRKTVDDARNRTMDRIIDAYLSACPD